MSNLADQIRRELDRRDIPRATYTPPTSTTPPSWSYGYGISEADGVVTVWCNPGNRTGRHSAALAERAHQILTLAGFRTYRDARRDPEQIVVSPFPARHERLARRSQALSALAIVCGFTYLATERLGLLLACGLSLIAAVALGIEFERRDRLAGRAA